MLRRSPHAALLWGAALVVAVVTTMWVGGTLASLRRQDTRYGRVVEFAVARRDLPIGRVVTRADLATTHARGAARPSGALGLRASEGRVLAVVVLRGQAVTVRHLAKGRDGLDGVVAPGHRAMRVAAADAPRLRAGDHVDVYVTFDPGQGSATSDPTLTVAEAVPVLALDRGNEAAESTETTGVTLMVDVVEAPRLAYASANGILALALVPPEDAHDGPTSRWKPYAPVPMTEPGAIEAIIFDYGGVISSPLFRGIGDFEAASGYPPGSLLRLLFGEVHYVGVEGRAVADTLESNTPKHVATDPLEDHDWHRLERGEIDFATYFGGLQARAPEILGVDLDVEAYGRFMTSTAMGVHWPVVHRIRELKADGFQLALLTNNIAEFGDHWKATFPLDELFEIVVDSSSVGMRKPDPAIYLLTLEQLDVSPTASVFVDDNADNIGTARDLGMQTVHFGEDPWVALAELDDIISP